MPDDVIDKIHRMARQQKNNPGLVFANCNLNLDEYDDNDDDETYYDNGNNEEEDKEVLSYNEEEGNDDGGDVMAVHGPPMANDDEEDYDDDGDEMGGQADVPPPVDLVQPPDNPPAEITGVEVADQGEEHGEPMGLEIPGVNEEETEPEIPGVCVAQESKVVENDADQPTQVEVTVEPPLAPHSCKQKLTSWCM